MERLIRRQLFPTHLIKSSYRLETLVADNQPAEPIILDSKDPSVSRTIYGVALINPRAEKVVVYSHANQEDLEGAVMVGNILREALDCSVICYEYTGYGSADLRAGYSPSQEALFADASRIAKYALCAKKEGSLGSACFQGDLRVYSLGRSLGGSMAIRVAADLGEECDGLVLLSAFSSVLATRLKQPMVTMLRFMDMFDNCEEIKKVNEHTPLLVIHGTNDALVPFEHSKSIYNASTCRQKHREPLANATHNSPLVANLHGGHRDQLIQKLEVFVK